MCPYEICTVPHHCSNFPMIRHCAGLIRVHIHSTLPVRPHFIFPNPPDKIQFEVRVPLSVRTVRAHFQRKHNPACRHQAEKLCTSWPLSRKPFAPLVWGSKSREWIEANVSNSKSNQKFKCQMNCQHRWKQEFILVFSTHCTQRQLFSRLWVSLSYNAYRQSRAKILGH